MDKKWNPIKGTVMKQEIIIDGNDCYVQTHIEGNTYKRELVMTKDVFVQCYEKWIKEQGDTDEP